MRLVYCFGTWSFGRSTAWLLIEQQLDGCSTSTSRPRLVHHWIFIVAEHYIEHAERILCLGCLDLLIVDYLHAAVIHGWKGEEEGKLDVQVYYLITFYSMHYVDV
ncbi:hypothetical protein BC629DRAFT_914654 [Irpex lacteus]|nr:hypothetical protein BC629DRAFT_914654 [Irpex lacteus]